MFDVWYFYTRLLCLCYRCPTYCVFFFPFFHLLSTIWHNFSISLLFFFVNFFIDCKYERKKNSFFTDLYLSSVKHCTNESLALFFVQKEFFFYFTDVLTVFCLCTLPEFLFWQTKTFSSYLRVISMFLMFADFVQ